MQTCSCVFSPLAACFKEKNTPVAEVFTPSPLDVKIALSIDAATDWATFATAAPLFLQKNYLRAIEIAPPKAMRFAYLSFYHKGEICGIAYAQIFRFSTYESLQDHKSFRTENNRWLPLKKWLARRLDFNALVCGNVLMTGEYGYFFDETVVPKAQQFRTVAQGLEQLRQGLQADGTPVSVTLFKDFYAENRPEIADTAFRAFQIQPAMNLELPAEWRRFEDYLAAMSSKYRTRAKRAFKKATDVEKSTLDLNAMRLHEARMFELYQQVVRSAGFNGVTLPTNYFTNLKRQLGETFQVVGYFRAGILVGFYTVFLEEKRLESHYLGLDGTENQDCQLYLNMLYDMVQMGIYERVETVAFARTALEIKSSVGAVPHDLFFYMQHHNPLLNAALTRLFDAFNPAETWQQRRPFEKGE